MNRFLLPLLILLWSLFYTGWWNCNRKPERSCGTTDVATTAIVPTETAVTADTVKAVASTPDTVKVVTAEEQILFTPLDLYFDVNKAGIKKTAEVETFLATAKKYLAKYPEKQLLITGHTDSDGSDESNQALSERRATQTKAFLSKEGIKTSQMTTEGKGEKEPVADNATAEGKAKNRRSTVRLKE